MLIHYNVRLLLMAAALAAPFSVQAITSTGHYTVTILGRVQHNYSDSAISASCVNDNGVVVGSANLRVPDNPGEAERGVLWQASTPHYTILGSISEADGVDSRADWINNFGIAVGGSSENTSQGMVFVPVMFTANGIVNLGRKNATQGEATCINNNSQVVGNLFYNTPTFAIQAFLYQNGVMTLLGYPVPTIGWSIANAINNNGLIVGQAVFAANGRAHAACYTNGAWVDLGTLGTDPSFTSNATSVNDSGTIVGTWRTDSQRGCFIYKNGQISQLNAPNRPGNPMINNPGQIVVGNFIYQNGVWQDINDLDLGDGWVFSEASGINNQGAIIGTMFRVINGTPLHRSGLLTPVNPDPQQTPTYSAPRSMRLSNR